MDKLASLRAFVKVVELGSFSEAGRQLRLSRSAVSKYVAELEEDLGVQLLNRTTRHVTPNENGQAYFERALGILADLDAADQAVAQLQATPRGLLRVNAPMSFGTMQLGPAIADFMAALSGIADPARAQRRAGRSGAGRVRRHACASPISNSSSLIARKIMPIERVVCASPGLSEAARHADASERTAQARLPDLRLSLHRQPMEADRQGRRSLDPARAGRCAPTMPKCCATRRSRAGASRCCRRSSPPAALASGKLQPFLADYPRRRWRSMRSIRRRGICRSRCACSSIFWSRPLLRREGGRSGRGIQ